MKAVILPTAKTGDLAPLTSWLPEFLLPVVNKPVVEHLIELLARHDVKEILLILKHMPYETEKYFGDGSRWGVRLSYSLLGSYRGITDALRRIEASKLQGSFLCLPADLVTDFDISDFANIQRQGQGNVCLLRDSLGSGHTGFYPATAEELRELDAYPLIMTWQAFTLMTRFQVPDGPSPILDLPSEEALAVSTCHISCSLQRIESLADLVTVNRRVLDGHFKSILIPGKLMEPGIWVGRHCRIHPGARLEAPLLIGIHCNIQEGASIGPGSVIGDQVIIDEGASVQASLVLDRTYVGAHAEIKDAIVKKNWMLQIPSMLHVHLGDDLILGDLEKKTLAAEGGRLLNMLLASVLLLLTSPLWVILFFYCLMFPSKKFFFLEKRMRVSGQMSLGGEMVPQTFDLYLFRSRNRLIRKLPGLINVIRGHLNLVGVSVLNEEELRQLPEEWREVRVNAPVGLFHLWELEARGELEWEEKMVMDSYYAAARSLWGDMKILGKALLATARG